MRKEFKRLKIPDEILSQLSDLTRSSIERVKLAETVRKQYGYAQRDMLELTQVASTPYVRCLHVIRSGDQDLYNAVVAGKIGLNKAASFARCPSLKQSENRYLLPKQENWTIIYETRKLLLHKENENCILRIVSCKRKQIGNDIKHYKEFIYQLDNAPFAIETVCHLLESGCTIRSNLTVDGPEKRRMGTLKHHILAAYYSVSVEGQYSEPVYLYNKKNTGDIRAKNLWCYSITGRPGVIRQGSEILILREGKVIAHTDYSRAMFAILNTDWGRLHTKSRDKRLALSVGKGSSEYLYHVRMAEYLYGLPADKAGFLEVMSKLHAEYLDKGFEIDHLDCDHTNNCLNNLMIMPKKYNAVKGSLTKQIKVPYFCWSERYDNQSIRMQAGHCKPLEKPVYHIEGVFSVKEYIEKLYDFVSVIKENRAILGFFEDKLDSGEK